MHVLYSFEINIIFNFNVSRWPAVCIHGDKSQNERDWVLQGKRLIVNAKTLSDNLHLIIVLTEF